MYLLLENPYHSLLHTNIIWQLTAFISELMLYSYLSSTFVQSESLSRAVFWLIFMSHNMCLSQSHKLCPHPHTRPLRPILLHTFRKCHWCLLFQNPGTERSNLASGSSWSCTCRSHQLWPVPLGSRRGQGRFGMMLVRHLCRSQLEKNEYMDTRVFQKWHIVKENCNSRNHPSSVCMNQFQEDPKCPLGQKR